MIDLEQQEDDRENPHAECEREIEARIAERDAALAELADAKAENVALWRVWVQSLGDGERKTLDALADAAACRERGPGQ